MSKQWKTVNESFTIINQRSGLQTDRLNFTAQSGSALTLRNHNYYCETLKLTAVLSWSADSSRLSRCIMSLSLASTMVQLLDSSWASVRWNAWSCVTSRSAACRSRSSRLERASIQPAWLASSLSLRSSTSRSNSCCLASELSRSLQHKHTYQQLTE